MPVELKKKLEEIYSKYNKRELVDPDPLVFVYDYNKKEDRELVGLIASSLAYGRVAQILKSVRIVLGVMGRSPSSYLSCSNKEDLKKSFKNFKHRFTDGKEMASFLWGIKNIVEKHGSIENCFLKGHKKSDTDMIPALKFFSKEMRSFMGNGTNSLLPDAEKSSACKRINLYLKWMVRKDDVDPGCWQKIDPGKLIIPLDTHMYRFGTCAGWTKRKNADMRTALEITEGFKKIAPKDPIKYDFAITRFGIRSDMCWKELGF